MESVYPDEYLLLRQQVKGREVNNYIMLLNIAMSPRTKPEDSKPFVESLMKQYKILSGIEDPGETLDVEGLENLKKFMRENSRLIKVRDKSDKLKA